MVAKKRKRKLKLSRVFLTLFFLFLVVFIVISLTKIKVKGFSISGNTYYTDNEILDMTGLSKYPSFLLTNSYNVSSKVKDNKLIKRITIKKTLYGRFNVTVTENKILFYDSVNNKSVTADGSLVSYYYEYSPVLVNEVNNKKVYNKIIEKMIKVNDDIFNNISEIKYEPNDIDKERFLLSMNDGNYVYVTMSKFSSINKYLDIVKTLDSKNGILYLDYGNYFVPKE